MRSVVAVALVVFVGCDVPPPCDCVVSATPGFSKDTLVFASVPLGVTDPQLQSVDVTVFRSVVLRAIDPAGDVSSFQLDSSSTCATATPATLSEGTRCTFVYSFTPRVRRSPTAQVTFEFDNGEQRQLLLQGQTTAEWSMEGSGIVTDFEAVWASGPADWWAVGHDAGCPIWRSAGDGMWTNECYNVTNKHLYTVSGTAPNDVWLGGDNGDVWHYDGTTTMTHQLPAPAGTIIRSIAAEGYGQPFARAADDNGDYYCLDGGGSFGTCAAPPPVKAIRVGAVPGFEVVGAVSGELWYRALGSASWMSYLLPPSLSGMQINAVVACLETDPSGPGPWAAAVGELAGQGAMYSSRGDSSITAAPWYAIDVNDYAGMYGLSCHISVGGPNGRILSSVTSAGVLPATIEATPPVATRTIRGMWATIGENPPDRVAVGDGGQILHFW